MPFTDVLAGYVETLELSAATLAIGAHIAFNLLIAAAFLPMLGPVAAMLDRRLPVDMGNVEKAGGSRLLELDCDGDIDTALSMAACEKTIRVCELVEHMFRDLVTALGDNDRELAKDIAARDDRVDRLHQEIKLFVTRATRDEMNDAQSRRAT